MLPCRPNLLDFDGNQFEPVWWCSDVIALPSGRQQTLWVGVNHGWRWPGCVLRVDASGAASIQFANAGHVDKLCRVTRPKGEFVVLGGENNAFDRSFVAVLGVSDPAACSPTGGAARCRKAAKERKEMKFTALLHHLTVDLLRESFYALKRKAAPGVDGMTWQEYEAGLEGRLVDLHNRVHRGTYPSLPSKAELLLIDRHDKTLSLIRSGRELDEQFVACAEGLLFAQLRCPTVARIFHDIVGRPV